MSDTQQIKAAPGHDAPSAGHTDLHPVDLNSYIRKCVLVFVAVLCATGAMIWTSFLDPAHYSWSFKVSLILAVATCNALVVAGFLMHLISEKKMIYTILSFTVVFVIGLFWLTWYAMRDFPTGTTFR